jgi:hypothetical protein
MPSVHGINDDNSGFGVKGENSTPASLGHFHEAGVVGTSQGGVGVFGTSGDISSMPIFGSADIGVQGASPDGTGVNGQSGSGHGVVGDSFSGDGVLGVGGKIGVHGRSNDVAVLGENTGSGTGVSGTTTGSGTGVSGTATGPGLGIGVSGSSFGNIGVEGAGGKEGVFGTSGIGNGVRGFSDAGTGVRGESGTGNGVQGDSAQDDAVVGFAHANGKAGVLGLSPNGNALAGISDNGTGIFAKGPVFAGFFQGNVDITGTLNHHGGDFHCDGNINTPKNITAFDVGLVGGDCAEDFDIAGPEAVEPGTVMVIDKEGALRPCQEAYDRKVTGVISGAGDYKPGIVLDKRPSLSNRLPLALVGKVYCKVDAEYGPVDVGDLLTTSSTPGHAMKVDNPLKALGSVIGKALRPLDAGQGLVPILVALQ